MLSAIDPQVSTIIAAGLSVSTLCSQISSMTLARNPAPKTTNARRGGGPKTDENNVWINRRVASTNRFRTTKIDSWRLKETRSGARSEDSRISFFSTFAISIQQPPLHQRKRLEGAATRAPA